MGFAGRCRLGFGLDSSGAVRECGNGEGDVSTWGCCDGGQGVVVRYGLGGNDFFAVLDVSMSFFVIVEVFEYTPAGRARSRIGLCRLRN